MNPTRCWETREKEQDGLTDPVKNSEHLIMVHYHKMFTISLEINSFSELQPIFMVGPQFKILLHTGPPRPPLITAKLKSIWVFLQNS